MIGPDFGAITATMSTAFDRIQIAFSSVRFPWWDEDYPELRGLTAERSTYENWGRMLELRSPPEHPPRAPHRAEEHRGHELRPMRSGRRVRRAPTGDGR